MIHFSTSYCHAIFYILHCCNNSYSVSFTDKSTLQSLNYPVAEINHKKEQLLCVYIKNGTACSKKKPAPQQPKEKEETKKPEVVAKRKLYVKDNVFFFSLKTRE